MTIPEYPITREEMYLDAIAKGSGGGVTVTPLSVTENGTYTAPSGTAYSPVTVNVPTPTPALIAKTVTANGTYTAAAEGADGYSSVTVDVAATGYTADDWLDNSKPTGAVVTDAVTLTANQLANKTGITSVSLPNATSIPDNFCKGCTGLSSVFAPKVTTLGTSAFADCAGLTDPVFMPLAFVGSISFAGCSRLPCAVVGSFGASTSYSMNNNTALAAVDVIGGNSMGGAMTFSNNTALKTLILRATSVCALGNLNIVGGTPFASGKSGGTLYVPSALISAYQSATNWSTVLGYPNNRIEAIEGSVYETQYADGTPIA